MPSLCMMSCCFFKQETLIHIVSLHPGVKIDTGEPLDFPSTGALYFAHRVKLRPCGLPLAGVIRVCFAMFRLRVSSVSVLTRKQTW